MLEWDDILLRLGLAVLFGGLVGFERERKDWAAGIRTHMLASLGSALVMMVSAFGFSDILGTPNVSLDPSRVASSVVIGVGYLGAGIILVLKPGNIKGLTTASALWTTAGIGLACGGGLFIMAGFATVLIIGILYGVQQLQRKLTSAPVRNSMQIIVADCLNAKSVISRTAEISGNISVLSVRKRKKSCQIDLTMAAPDRHRAAQLLNEIQSMPEVRKVHWK